LNEWAISGGAAPLFTVGQDCNKPRMAELVLQG